MFDVWNMKYFVGREPFHQVCKGPALWNFGIADEYYFFALKRDTYATGGEQCAPPPRPNRVKTVQTV